MNEDRQKRTTAGGSLPPDRARLSRVSAPRKAGDPGDQAAGDRPRPGARLFPRGRRGLPGDQGRPATAARFTARANLVAVVTNGTAVLGLGNIGALASKPVMEGKAVLFKKFANIDCFDIELNESDPERLAEIVCALEPTFGAINLEDIKAPDCFIVEKICRERMGIPVFHDDQHGTAIVVGAAATNALRIAGKAFEDIKVVSTGGGAAGIACLNMLLKLGVRRENVWLCDLHGLVHEGREIDMNPQKAAYAQTTDKRHLEEVIDGADSSSASPAPAC
jgi:malate dehydrogenase (oxaloacetate-decarboxylating)(NADP+)